MIEEKASVRILRIILTEALFILFMPGMAIRELKRFYDKVPLH